MADISNKSLISSALGVVHPRKGKNFSAGEVGAALITECGRLYTGVCIDTGSSMGFCAEHNAIGSMVTDGETRIRKIVAVWKDENGNAYVLSPCGRCRQFMVAIDERNIESEVILACNQTVVLGELLPHCDSFTRIDNELVVDASQD